MKKRYWHELTDSEKIKETMKTLKNGFRAIKKFKDQAKALGIVFNNEVKR